MEPDPRTASRPHRLRPLNEPVPVKVETGPAGQPVAVTPRGRRRRAVAEIQDAWRVDEGWWRPRPVSRLYLGLVLDDGQHLTIYRDLLQETWWIQRY